MKPLIIERKMQQSRITQKRICPHCHKEILFLSNSKQMILDLLQDKKVLSITEIWKGCGKKISYKNTQKNIHDLEKLKKVNIEKGTRYNRVLMSCLSCITWTSW